MYIYYIGHTLPGAANQRVKVNRSCCSQVNSQLCALYLTGENNYLACITFYNKTINNVRNGGKL